jgi:hypothetical protein
MAALLRHSRHIIEQPEILKAAGSEFTEFWVCFPSQRNRSRGTSLICGCMMSCVTASVVEWSQFLATVSEVPGSIHGSTRLPE